MKPALSKQPSVGGSAAAKKFQPRQISSYRGLHPESAVVSPPDSVLLGGLARRPWNCLQVEHVLADYHPLPKVQLHSWPHQRLPRTPSLLGPSQNLGYIPHLECLDLCSPFQGNAARSGQPVCSFLRRLEDKSFPPDHADDWHLPHRLAATPLAVHPGLFLERFDPQGHQCLLRQ